MHSVRKRREEIDIHELHLKMSLIDMDKYFKVRVQCIVGK